MANLSAYYRLTKPGIVYGNSIALIAGFFYFVAVDGVFSLGALLLASFGTALVMASACVANNIIDKDIDVYMNRTKERALVKGTITSSSAGIFSAALLLIGSGMLYFTNLAALGLAISGWILYVIPYTYLKRHTYHATLVGALPGAVPPLVGYYAAGGVSLYAAFTIFLTLVAWQMVHFYAIAIFRQQEYAAASVPIITVVKGVPATIRHMEVWTFISGVALLASIYYTNTVYAALALALTAWWFRKTVYSPGNDTQWARSVFFASLFFLVLWLVATVISALFLLV